MRQMLDIAKGVLLTGAPPVGLLEVAIGIILLSLLLHWLGARRYAY